MYLWYHHTIPKNNQTGKHTMHKVNVNKQDSVTVDPLSYTLQSSNNLMKYGTVPNWKKRYTVYPCTIYLGTKTPGDCVVGSEQVTRGS